GAGAAIAHGLELMAAGADLIDVGGESTRPGAQRIDEDEELRRVGPVITELVRAGLPGSGVGPPGGGGSGAGGRGRGAGSARSSPNWWGPACRCRWTPCGPGWPSS